MSPFAAIQDQNARALAPVHEDDLVLMPDELAVKGVVEVVEPRTGQPQFQTGEELASHNIHIRRDALTDIVIGAVLTIQLADQVKTYRVRTVDDDPATGPHVVFRCTLG